MCACFIKRNVCFLYVELAGQGRKQRDRVKEDEDIFKRRSDDEANKPRKNKKKKKSLATVPLFKRQAGFFFVQSPLFFVFVFFFCGIHPT